MLMDIRTVTMHAEKDQLYIFAGFRVCYIARSEETINIYHEFTAIFTLVFYY
jgi:hypothetical protein